MPACIICKKQNANFQFPRDPAQLKIWMDNLGLSEENRPRSSARLCFLHFPSSQIRTTAKGHWRLLPGAVPDKEERQSTTCERVPVIQPVRANEEVQSDTNEGDQGSTQDTLLSTVILITGTLFICFLPFLLFFLSSRRDSVEGMEAVEKRPQTIWRLTPVD